jgi:ADP-ribose pyrophosphatase
MEPEIVAQGKFLRLVKAGRWEYCERTRANGIVVIVPLIDPGQVVFVEQYRPPVKANCIEFPAGLSGDLAEAANESLATAARRELLEETGFAAEELQYVGRAAPTAGLTSEVMSYFVARGLRRVAAGGGVEHEKITTHVVPLAEVRAWLQEQDKRAMISAMVYSGLYLSGN